MSSESGERIKKSSDSESKIPGLKFIADAMLGRLARWLRLLGFDTLYQIDISDAELLRIARQENRIVLTRDTHFLRFKDFTDYFLINSNDTFDQLSEVITGLNISGFKHARCTACNGIFTNIQNKREVKGLVPDYVYIHINRFMRCNDCGNIYWEGSHIKRFMERVCDRLKEGKIN